MANDEFDLSDFGSFDQSSIAPEQEGEVPPIPEPPRQGRNTTFIIGAIVGIIAFVLALCLVAFFIYNQANGQVGINATSTAVVATNWAVQTAYAQTLVVKSWSPTPSDTATFTPSSTYTPSLTLTSSNTPTVTQTPTPTLDLSMTADAHATETAIKLLGAGQQTAVALTETANALASAQAATNAAATLTAIAEMTGVPVQADVTPSTPAGITDTPGGVTFNSNGTPIHVIVDNTLVVVIVTPTRTPRPTQANGMPGTGIFDDIAAGKASPSGLAMVGFATIGLLGVIVAARRMRSNHK